MALNDKWIRYGICLLLGAFIFYIYYDVRNFEFVNYDDPRIISENPTVTGGLTWPGLKAAWTEPVVFGLWCPLTAMTHMVHWDLFGADAGKHHLVHVFLHLANVLLLLFTLHRMTKAFWPSALVAFLVAVHPLNVEVVAWASQTKTLLCLFFSLGSLWFYNRYCEEPKRRPYLLAILFFFCALLSKPLLITLPFLLLLIDFWPLNRWMENSKHHPEALLDLIPSLRQRNLKRGSLLLLEKIPFFSLTALSSLLTYQIALHSWNLADLTSVPLADRLWNAIFAYSIYLQQAILPLNLAVLYPWKSVDVLAPFTAGFTCLICISSMVIWQLKNRPYLALGWFWYLGVLVPVIGLVDSGIRAHADRYAYASLIGIFIALAWTIRSLCKNDRATLIISIITLFPVMISTQLSKQQVAVWQNSISLFQHAIRVGYPSGLAHNNLGTALMESHQYMSAKIEFQKALQVDPLFPEAMNNLGVLLVRENHPEEALPLLEKACRLRPKFAEAFFNLGNTHHALRQYDQAIRAYDRAQTLRPYYPEATYNLHVCRMDQRYFNALKTLEAKTTISPLYLTTSNPRTKSTTPLKTTPFTFKQTPDAPSPHPHESNARFAEGLAAMDAGKWSAAIRSLEQSVACDPDHANAKMNLSFLYLRTGKVEEGSKMLHSLARVSSDKAGRVLDAAYDLQRRGMYAESLIFLNDFLSHHPSDPFALTLSAWILATAPEKSLRNESESLRRALEAYGQFKTSPAVLLDTLAAAWAENGDFADALFYAEKALKTAQLHQEVILSQAIEQRIQLYRAHQAYHQRREWPPITQKTKAD